MKRLVLGLALMMLIISASAQRAVSPNGKISVDTKSNELVVSYEQQPMLDIPFVGYEGAQTIASLKPSGQINTDYWMISGKQPRYVCLDEKPADCSFEKTNAKQQFVDSLAWECPMNHLKADSSLVGYQCHDNVGYISVEEGEKRRQEYKDWLDRRQGT